MKPASHWRYEDNLQHAGAVLRVKVGSGASPVSITTEQHSPAALPRPPPPCSQLTALVACVALLSLTFDASKVEGLLLWVQEHKGKGSVLFLVRGCKLCTQQLCHVMS